MNSHNLLTTEASAASICLLMVSRMRPDGLPPTFNRNGLPAFKKWHQNQCCAADVRLSKSDVVILAEFIYPVHLSSGLPFVRSGQNHFAKHSERRKKTRQTEKEMERQRQGMDRPGVRQVPEGSGEQRKLEETGCEVICGAPTTPAATRLVRKKKKKIYFTPVERYCGQVCCRWIFLFFV